MPILPECKECKRKNRYTANENNELCAKCLAQGNAQGKKKTNEDYDEDLNQDEYDE